MEYASIRRQGKRLFVWAVAVAIVVVALALAYFGMALHGTDASIDSVADNPNISVTQHDETYVLEPASGDSATGLVFYPGGRVHPDAYLATLAPLVTEANATVVVPKMPLNLAVLDQGAAQQYVSDQSVDSWYVGGHSLGGAMACRYARANPDSVDGVVLFAAYCDQDISDTGLAVLSVTGSADTVLDWSAYESNRDNLPADATVRELPLNHSQFGSYRGQPGDAPSTLAYEEAHERLANVTVSWVRSQG